MRFRLPLAAFATLLAPLAAMTTMCCVSACGQSDNSMDASTDATKDHTTADVAPDVAPEGGGCDAGYLPEGGFDAGTFSVCLGCFESMCGSNITACNGDCLCRQGVLDLVSCITMTMDVQNCLLNALGNGNTNLSNLLTCGIGHCQSICQGAVDGGSDSGNKDASTDAPGDGG
jgi:hypothetical protein